MAMKATSNLPTMLLSGRGYQKILVVVDGHVIGRFNRSEALNAQCCMFGALYVFGLSYDNSSRSATSSSMVKNFFDLISA